MIVLVRKWILRSAFALFRSLRVRRRVVLASSHATRLSGNLEFIFNELKRQLPEVEIVVLTRRQRHGLLGKVGVLREGIRAEYYLATSSVFIVDDYFFPIYVITPKPETTIIQTWHASDAFKKIGYSVLDKTFGANETLVRHVRIHSNYDHILMGSQNSVPAYIEAFDQPAERFVTELGIPRTDVFFDRARIDKVVSHVRAKYALPAGKKVILYAPTFRGDSKYEATYHDDLDLGLMRQRCGDDWVLLLRLHPFVSGNLALDPSLEGFVYNVSDHSDINELVLASDLLVTDYSSVIFEYALLGRPMAFFAPDYEAYEAERGFYFPYVEGVPGPVFETTEGIADYIAAGHFDMDRVASFRDASFDVADGHASERFVEQLVVPALVPAEKDAAGPSRLNVLFIGGFDSTNYAYVELIRGFEARGHSCTVLVNSVKDVVNNKMFANAGIVMTPLSHFSMGDLSSVDVVFSGQFIRRPQRHIFDAIARDGIFLISFANLFSAVTMRVPADLIITSCEGKFAEFAASGLDYNMVAVGNPQYDPLIRSRSNWQSERSSEIREVLVVDQGAYPLGARGKEQLASALVGMASSNPDVTFHVKPRYLPSEHGEYLHSLSHNLYHYLDDAPSNLVLIHGAETLEELVLNYDAMITTWSTAHLDAAVLGMPLMLIGGLDSVDVFDVRKQRVAAAYDHLDDTGCVIDWREVQAGRCRFARVSEEYLREEFYDIESPCAPKVVDLVEGIDRTLLKRGRAFDGRFQLNHEEFMRTLENGIETRAAGSQEDRLDRALYRGTNAIIQELAFGNRCMGSVLDMAELLPFWRTRLVEGSTVRDVRREVKQVGETSSSLRERYFRARPDEVASDKFIQDHYFDWLYATGRHAELLSYSGPLVAPESFEYNKGLVLLGRGRLFSAARHVIESFSISLVKPVRELRKDRNITVLLSRTDRNLLAHAILFFLDARGKREALSVVDIPAKPDVDALVFYRMKALVALGQTDAALALHRQYAETSQHAAAASPRAGSSNALLLIVVGAYRLLLRRYAARIG